MPVQIIWDDAEQTTIRFEMTGKWSWDEFYGSYENIWDEVTKVGHRVDAIADVTQTTHVPAGSISRVRSYASKRPENTGIIVFAGANSYLTAIMQTVQNLFKTVMQRSISIRFATTLDEARAIIAEARAKDVKI
ncbi:MAG: hypothetical protein ABI690_01930 [Chloroflexota bacterium]